MNDIFVNENEVNSVSVSIPFMNKNTLNNNVVVSLDNSINKKKQPWKTGLVYDEKMTKYFCINKHDQNHVERPKRIAVIFKILTEKGVAGRCETIKSRLATREELLLKQNENHVSFIESLGNKTDDELEELCYNFDSIYFHANICESAFLAAGCTFEIVEQVLEKKILNGAAIVRPPGHHALAHCSMGFCHFNNVAIAAELAIKKYNIKRVLIVDWDIHYGNGTHKMFEHDSRVLYFSPHRYDQQLFWPCLVEGNYDSIGSGDGEGFNIHVAWNKSGMGDAEYKLVFEKLLMPVAQEYNPELVLISAGFDSGKGDPLGNFKITPNGYAYMTKQLMSLADGKVVLVLEGGYNLKTLATSMLACVKTLIGDPINDNINSMDSCESAKLSIAHSIMAVQKFWASLSIVDDMFFNSLALEKENVFGSLYSSNSDESLEGDGLLSSDFMSSETEKNLDSTDLIIEQFDKVAISE